MPPKSKSTAKQETRFLFVNEDANSIFTRDIELNRTKQRHVQRTSFAQRRLEQGRRFLQWNSETHVDAHVPTVPTSSSSHQDFLIPEDRFFSLTEVAPLPSAFDHTTFLTQPFTPDPLPPLEFSFDISAIGLPFGMGENETEYTHENAASFLPESRPWSPTADPFPNMETALRLWAPVLMEYFTKTLLPSVFHLDMRVVPLQQMRHTSAIREDLERCFTEPAHLYSLLAFVSARMLAVEGHLPLKNLSEEMAQRVPAFFETRAIQIVRRKLSSEPLTLDILGDTLRLLATARNIMDKGAWDSHSEALLQMMDHLGGFDKIGDYTKERIISAYVLSGLERLEKPQMPLCWDPGHLPVYFTESAKSTTDLTRQPPGRSFMNPAKKEVLGSGIQELVTDIEEVVSTLLSTQSSGTYQPNLYTWIAFRRAAVDYRLLALPIPKNSKDSDHQRQQCTRLALLFWIGTTIGDPIRKVISAKTCNALRVALERRHLKYLWHPHTDLLLWVTSVGALVAGNPDDYVYFAKLAAIAAKALRLDNFVAFEEVLEGFFYLPDMQKAAVETLYSHFSEMLDLDSPDREEEEREEIQAYLPHAPPPPSHHRSSSSSSSSAGGLAAAARRGKRKGKSRAT